MNKQPKTQGKIEEIILKINSQLDDIFDEAYVKEENKDYLRQAVCALFRYEFKAQQNNLLERVLEIVGEDDKFNEYEDNALIQARIQIRNELRADLKTKISQMGEEYVDTK